MYPIIFCQDSGEKYSLQGRVITIGSSSESHISLKNLPERAAHILYKNGRYFIYGIGDIKILLNKNILPTGGTALTNGDIIEIGKYRFKFIDDIESESPYKLATEKDKDFYFLQELISIATTLLRTKDENLFGKLVANVSKLLKGDGCRLVIDSSETGERRTIAKYPENVGTERFSNRAIDWAKESGHTIIMAEQEWKEKIETNASLEKNLISSILCAPLSLTGKNTGFLYLDRLGDTNPFTEEDRTLCDALLPLFSEILNNFEQRQQQRLTIERLQKIQVPSGGMIFESDKMNHIITMAKRFAKTDSPILIMGETGTGKELLAKFIHENSSRANGPFKAINCGALPENLIESELFGHEKGAFTGAVSKKIGLFESANEGTIFLDEIGELPLHLQVKLLRVLQQSEIVRVGGTESISVNIRILAATNRNLEEMVKKGEFREDLYFRLNVLAITLPPLKERNDDVILLSEYFIIRYCQQFGIEQKILTPSAKTVLKNYHWPGNIRELENVIQKAILTTESNRLTADSFEIKSAKINYEESLDILTLHEARNRAEKETICKALAKTEGNVSKASRLLDIDRKWLIKKMEEFDISALKFKKS